MKQLVTYPKPEDKKIILEASQLVGLKASTFLTTCAVKEARKIIKENQEAISINS